MMSFGYADCNTVISTDIEHEFKSVVTSIYYRINTWFVSFFCIVENHGSVLESLLIYTGDFSERK